LCLVCLATAGCGVDQSTSRSDKPVSREAAAKAISLPFPVSATNIYYAVHSGGMQEFQMFVRFTVSRLDESNAISGILADHSEKMLEQDSYPAVSFAEVPNLAYGDLAPMPWWKPSSITNGYCRRGTNGQPFYIWH